MRLTKENILTALDYNINDYERRLKDGMKNKQVTERVKGKIEALKEFREDIEDQFYHYSTDIFNALKETSI